MISDLDAHAALARGRRLFLVALVPGPLIAIVLAISIPFTVSHNKIETTTYWSIAFWIVLALSVFFFGFSKRNSPTRWASSVKKSTFFFGVLSGIIVMMLVLIQSSNVAIAYCAGGATFLVSGVLPWLMVRAAAKKVIEQPALSMVHSEAELSFPVRGEEDGWFLVDDNEIRIRIRREMRKRVWDNHDDRVDFTAIQDTSVVELLGQETAHVGLGYEAHTTAGPAVRLLIMDENRGSETEEWIVPIDQAWEAIEAIQTRRLSIER